MGATKSKMRVLHLKNIAGTATNLSRAQRKLGVQADVCVFAPDSYGWEVDKIVTKSTNRLKTVRGLLFLLGQSDYDLYHLHTDSFVKWGLERLLLRTMFKPTILQYHGSELRGKRKHSKNQMFISTPDLRRWLTHPESATWLPYPCDPEPFIEIQPVERSNLVVGYYLSRDVRSSFIPVAALLELSIRLGFTLRSLSDIPHHKVAEFYRSVDVLVDKIGMNFYGGAAVEAAMSGKPIITQIGKKEAAEVPGCPFINVTSTEQMGSVLRELMIDRTKLDALGELSRKYAIATHNSMTVAKIANGVYATVLRR